MSDRKEYLSNYRKQKIKRVPFDIQLSEYEKLKEYTEKNGESINGYLKRLIREDMQRNSDK